MCIAIDTETKAVRATRAFTLIEVTISLAIMSLLAGVLYALVGSTLRGAAEVEQKEIRLQEFSGLLALCRSTFYALPPTATLEVRVVNHDGRYLPELIFRNAREIFQWGKENPYYSTILGVRPQVGGQVSLGMLQDKEDEINSYLNGGTASRPWLILMANLRSVTWRFYDARGGVWATEWHDITARPACAELTLQTETSSERFVFTLPPVKVATK